MTDNKNIKILDIQEVSTFFHSDPEGVAIIMPCTDVEEGQKTAETLHRRAGMPCNIFIVHDTIHQGFVKTLNQTAARISAKYIVYLAQDAWPSRGWLKCAFDSLEKSGKGLLAFNDGKWSGHIASFGMVRTSWLRDLYSGDIFYPGYHSHAADNELTVIARVQDMHVYNPECTLVEHDPDKDFGGSNPVDRKLFKRRFIQGFDGLVPLESLIPLAEEYKVNWEQEKSARGVSIIILTLNAAHHLDRLLSTFLNTNTHKPFELIIIDHGSSDNTAATVSRYIDQGVVRLVSRGRNYSFSESCNLGAELARYPHLLFLNNDIIYTSDVLPQALARLENNPGVGAVGVRLDDVPQDDKEQGVQHLGIEFKWNERRGYHQPEQIRHPSLKEFLSSLTTDHQSMATGYAVTGAFMLVRKSDFNKLNCFSTEYNYGLEDIDFCLRLHRDLKKKCCCINGMGLQHVEGATRKKWDKDEKSEIIEKNHRIFKEKWERYVKELLNSQHKAVLDSIAPAKLTSQNTAPKIKQNKTLIGHIEAFEQGVLRGWAVDKDDYRRAVDVTVLVDGREVATGKADIFRENLKKKGYGSGKHFFRIGIPVEFCDRKEHEVEIRDTQNNLFIQGKCQTRLCLHERKMASYIGDLKKLRQHKGNSKGTRKNLLFVAHLVNKRIYGSERSLLDLIKAIDCNHYNVIVILPTYSDYYFELIKENADKIIIFKYDWYNNDNCIDQHSIALFNKIIQNENIDLVYANTIMIREPLIAARQNNVPSVCHIREIINHDPYLSARFNCHPSQIITDIKNIADCLISNSKTTQRVFSKLGSNFLVYNAIDVDSFDIPNIVDSEKLYVGMIGSNIEKKGVYDLLELAKAAEKVLPNIIFRLIGPENEDIRSIQEIIDVNNGPHNIEVVGYIKNSVEAVSKLNVCVNFSHFAESFGRSVLESMGARRPVIVYDWGALPELVVHGECGYIIPYRHPLKALEYLKAFSNDPDLMLRMGEKGRDRAIEKFSFKIMQKELNNVLSTIFKKWNNQKQPDETDVSNACQVQAANLCTTSQCQLVSVIIPNYNYETYIEERLQSILNQTYKNIEIIFLDDASSDNSVKIAENILKSSNLPFRMFVNEKNQGVYNQWLRGIKEAQGDLIWIAEADDSCESDMLSRLVEEMQDESVVIAYCQSKRFDEHGNVTASDNLHHTNDLDKDRWKYDYKEIGLREVVDYLIYRNTIPNSSACLLRKSAINGIEHNLSKCKYSGDKLLYVHMLKSGNIAYLATPMNRFRRHTKSVTSNRGKDIELLKEVTNAIKFICDNFPVHSNQLPHIKFFLDKNYKIKQVDKNSEHSSVVDIIKLIKNTISKNKRFAFITTNNGSYDGGSELWWRESAKKLRSLGHDVSILIKKWNPRPPFLYEFDKLGIKSYYKEEAGLESILSYHLDLIIVSVGDQDEGIEYYFIFQQKAIPYIIVNRLTKEPRFWPICHKINNTVKEGYLGAEKVFFASKNNHEVMENRLKCKVPKWGRIYSPCHADREAKFTFPSISQGINFAVPAKILFIHKGQDLLVDVFRQKKWKERIITINFYGVGKDQERLKQMVQDAGLDKLVVFHGKIVNIGREHEISNIWLKNQAVLMPTRMEGFPNMVVNAMLSERVPIVTDIGGHAEVIQDGVTGFIAANPTAKDIDEALERAYQRQNEWEVIGQKARKVMCKYLPEDPVEDAAHKILEVAKTTSIKKKLYVANSEV